MDSFVCRIVVFDTTQHRALKQRKMDNLVKASVSKKCLFGKADPEDTKKLLEEQFEQDNARFRERFGFDVRDLEDLEDSCKENRENRSSDANVEKNTNKSAVSRKILKARRLVCSSNQQRQQYITDFYQARKTVQSLLQKEAK